MADHDDPIQQPLSIHAAEVSAVITCHCRLGNQPMLISSVALEAVCGYCRKVFGIASVQYDVKAGLGVAVLIAMREPQPESKTPLSASGAVTPFRRM